MAKGFMYLTAVIDVYSRFIVGWQLSNTLDKETQTDLIEDLFDKYGTPEIINSDQGSQYTCDNWINCLKSYWVFRSYGASLFGSNGATFRDTTILDKSYDYSFFSAPFLMDSPLRSIL